MNQAIPKRTNKLYDRTRFDDCRIRVYHRAGRNDQDTPRYLLKCGCCPKKVEIYYDKDSLEINGVNGGIEDWREILLPLLMVKQKGE